jgi:hypothetical protein
LRTWAYFPCSYKVNRVVGAARSGAEVV